MLRAPVTPPPILAVALGAALAAQTAQGATICGRSQDLKAPDRAAVVRISTSPEGPSCGESAVELRIRGAVVAQKSFRSQDGQHGYGVRTAEWTADSRYFVFDLTSSGGHQPLYSPLFVFDVRRRSLRAVSLSGRLSPSSFRLLAGDSISVDAWDTGVQAMTSLAVRLDH